ncbi:MAG: glutamate--cysteine ligase [Gammaproteobacteria bacterium]|nr:glutamate--cysteine ligase [Gammaproteobacteria bacterium]
MHARTEQRLRRIVDAGGTALLGRSRKGIEKESLRVARDGSIAQTPHPVGLGSALTHPYITTDYSEALIELITPPFADVRETLGFLDRVHQFVYATLDNELLWATSMPCAVGDDRQIPIAQYGSSNIGRMKHVYRVGLDWRYGRRMQAISGVHFNFSFADDLWRLLQEEEEDAGTLQDFVSENYFAIIRNFQRLAWVVPYLFGASPAVCKSFLSGRASRFEELDPSTWYMPYATSLRMSDIGYQNKNQTALGVSYDSLDSYVTSLGHAIRTPYPEYEAIGVREDGEYRQLNTNVLQIENEYYSYVRPKQTTRSGEKPTHALRARGVEYVEVRALDVNVFEPSGVGETELRFIEALLLYCLILDSPPVTAQALRVINYNELTVALRGREPGLKLQQDGRWRPLTEWLAEICLDLEAIAAILDGNVEGRPYAGAVRAQLDKLAAPETLPSARILARMRERGHSFSEFGMVMSRRHESWFRGRGLDPAVRTEFEALARRSIEEQRAIEAADDVTFEEYLARYFASSA